MASVKPLIAVATASSTTGAACVEALLGRYKGAVRVRGAFRSAEKAAPFKAKYKESAFYESVESVDADAPQTLSAAFENATGAVIVTPMDHRRGIQDDAKLAANMVRSAVDCGVKHIVLIGSWTVIAPEALPLLASRFAPTERLLQDFEKSHGLQWTSLRSGFFNSNLDAMFGSQLHDGNTTVRWVQTALPPVDPSDVGRVAASIMASEDSSQYHGKCYDISGPQMLTSEELVAAYSHGTGRQATFEAVPPSALTGKVPAYLAELLVYLHERGDQSVPFSDDTMRITGEHTSLSEWFSRVKKT